MEFKFTCQEAIDIGFSSDKIHFAIPILIAFPIIIIFFCDKIVLNFQKMHL